MDIKEILSKRPTLHRTAQGMRAEMGVHAEVIEFLLEHVPEGGVTLETGCGLSTILFAHKGRQHTAITPTATEIADLMAFCQENGVRTDGLEIIEGTSEYVLPSLKGEPLDVVLIDGRHGFPQPFIDWFYTAGRLKIGGLLLVDDTWLWPPRVLYNLLAEQPQWELVGEIGGRTGVFRKKAEGSEWGDWTDQPYSYRKGQLRLTPDGGVAIDAPASSPLIKRVAHHIRRGEWSVLVGKALSKLRIRRSR